MCTFLTNVMVVYFVLFDLLILSYVFLQDGYERGLIAILSASFDAWFFVIYGPMILKSLDIFNPLTAMTTYIQHHTLKQFLV